MMTANRAAESAGWPSWPYLWAQHSVKSIPLSISVVVILLAGPGIAPRSLADELVQVAPHRADIIPRAETLPLFGYLSRPAGPGPFPAVVLLHWCSGFGLHDIIAAARLKSWGYVALALDSLGNSNRCEHGGGAYPEAVDAYAALKYLSQLSFVMGRRIAVMGYSMGAIAVLDAVEAGLFDYTGSERFQAAIAYYPNCEASTGIMTAPTLILIGDKDDWSRAAACEEMAAGQSEIGITRAKGKGAPVDLMIYPGATHAFDAPEPSRIYLGHFMEYDPKAAGDAEMRVRAFLQSTLRSPG